MKEKFNFGATCKFIGALVYSIGILSIPVITTFLICNGVHKTVSVVFAGLTGLELMIVAILLYNLPTDTKKKK